MTNFYSHTYDDFKIYLRDAGFSDLHAKVVFKLLYGGRKADTTLQSSLLSLPIKLRTFVDSFLEVGFLKVKSNNQSKYDHSVKFVMQAEDGSEIESVLMPEKNRITLCVSSQVGCAQGCVFCHTGRMGLKRNLKVEEIVGQVVLINQWIEQNKNWDSGFCAGADRITNVVFMGMGEPFDNVKNVSNAVRVMITDCGLGIAPRKITVSTAGHLDGMKEFASQDLKTGIAFSLHALDDKSRSKLMPINKRWGLEPIVQWLRSYTNSKRHVLIQYTVIAGVNDSKENAEQLIKLLHGVNYKLNLIPLNPIEVGRLMAPDKQSLENFRDALFQGGVRVMVRYSKGQDITAACGQLVRTNHN